MSDEIPQGKLVVIADDTGTILAAYKPGFVEGEDGPQVELTALEGQITHVVDMPPELAKAEETPEIIAEFRLEADGTEAKLVRLWPSCKWSGNRRRLHRAMCCYLSLLVCRLRERSRQRQRVAHEFPCPARSGANSCR